jgi:predicted nucleic acid-binding protein
MIVLDTNVVSEPLRPGASATVKAWLNEQASETMYLTSVSYAEMLAGIEMLPAGRRKTDIAEAVAEVVERFFGTRILPFDTAAARAYAEGMARARSIGQTISIADGQIAAIAATHGFMVATRDTAPFAAAGLKVINPWLAHG